MTGRWLYQWPIHLQQGVDTAGVFEPQVGNGTRIISGVAAAKLGIVAYWQARHMHQTRIGWGTAQNYDSAPVAG